MAFEEFMKKRPIADVTPPELGDLSDEAFVHHCYARLLHRACSLNEAMRALGALEAGASRSSFWQEIRHIAGRNDEYLQSADERRICALLLREGQDFISGAYRLVLKRAPDSEGLQTYSAAIAGGATNSQIFGEILKSPEALQQPTTAALSQLFNALTSGGTKQGSPLGLADLWRLYKLPLSDFLDSAYRTMLGREADRQGRDYYAERLNKGYTKLRVIAELALSDESKTRPRTLGVMMLVRVIHHL